MTSDHGKPEAETTGSPALILEIAGQEEPTPRRFPVLLQNLSMGGVTLAVATPWGIADWDRYRGKDCVLRMEDPGDRKLAHIKAKISWTKFGRHWSAALVFGSANGSAPRGSAQTVERSSDPHLSGYQGALGQI